MEHGNGRRADRSRQGHSVRNMGRMEAHEAQGRKGDMTWGMEHAAVTAAVERQGLSMVRRAKRRRLKRERPTGDRVEGDGVYAGRWLPSEEGCSAPSPTGPEASESSASSASASTIKAHKESYLPSTAPISFHVVKRQK